LVIDVKKSKKELIEEEKRRAIAIQDHVKSLANSNYKKVLTEEEYDEIHSKMAEEQLRSIFNSERKNKSKQLIRFSDTIIEVQARKYFRTFFDTKLKAKENIKEEIKDSIMPKDGIRNYLDFLIADYRKNKKSIKELDLIENERRKEIQRRLSVIIVVGRRLYSEAHKESIFNVIVGKKPLKIIPQLAKDRALSTNSRAMTGEEFLRGFVFKKSTKFQPSRAELEEE